MQKQTFLFNTNLAVRQQNRELEKFEGLLAADDEIVRLRTSVKASAYAQLENGVINSSDYLKQVDAEDQARQARILHEIQMLSAAYNKQIATGQ